MSEYRKANCPYCGKESTGTFRVDSGKQKAHVTCTNVKCKKSYAIIHGDNEFEVVK